MIPGNRRSKIRPPRKSLISSSLENATTDAVFDFEKTWLVLSNAIVQIQNKNVSSLSYEQLYRNAYMLVLRKHGGKLYENVSQLISQHLLSRREYLISIEDDEQFMKLMLAEWDENLQSMKFISDVLMYLNRVYVKEHKKLFIYDLGIQLFKSNVIELNNNEIGSKVSQIIIDEYTKTRRGQVITTNMYISKLINMLQLLVQLPSNTSDLQTGDNYYQQFFEPLFFASSETFFYQFVSKIPNIGTSYLDSISQFIKEEESRMNLQLPDSTHGKLTNLMNNILIKDKIDSIMCLPQEQKGFSYLLEPALTNVLEEKKDNHHLQYLSTLYNVLGRTDDTYKLLRLRLKENILLQGADITEYVRNSLESTSSSSKKSSTNSPAFATKWIDKILEYRDQLQIILDECFKLDFSVGQTILNTMHEFINNTTKKSVNAPELLSVYMDHYIKQITKATTSKDISSDPTNDLIVKSLSFLKYIKDKDAFEAYYANHFAKRFLNSKGSSQIVNTNNKLGVNIEELLISKLSEEMGTSSLDKIIKMNKDIKLSKDTSQYWKNHVETHSLDVVELDVKICNVLDWPKAMTKDYKSFGEDSKFIWSRQLRPTIKQFEEFWCSGNKNSNKSMYWSPKFGSIDLRITYPSRTYEINLATYAGIIMLLFAPQSSDIQSAFEENREFTYEEIEELTGIPEIDLKRHLQSIAVAPKSRLLIKLPMSKEINKGDVFKLNSQFKSPSVKVKVLTVSAASSTRNTVKTERELEQETLQADISVGRQIEVNAAIVRIMKSRRQLKHNELIEELIKQLSKRFLPPIIMIKQRIELLIEKEYLKRDENDKNLYHYLA